MRFARQHDLRGRRQSPSHVLPAARRTLRSTVLCCGALALSVLTGCNANPLDIKSFIDPAEMGRYRHQSLTLPIMDHVDPGIEEPNVQFVNAVEPVQDDLMLRPATTSSARTTFCSSKWAT